MTPLARMAPARRRFWTALGAAALAVVLAVGVGQLVTGEPELVPVAQDEPGPVLLVPGYGGDTTSLEVLADALAETGRDVEIVRPTGGGTGDLVAQARRLGRAAQAEVDRGAPSVDVVGYSAGGVVVRWWVAELGGASLARRVVTLASPHHGTEVAGLGAELGGEVCPTACEQLAPDSDLLATLDQGDETPPGPAWVALWTEDDATVVPPTSGELEGAAVNVPVQALCPRLRVQHADVPRTPAVIEIVEAALGAGPPGLPPRPDCG